MAFGAAAFAPIAELFGTMAVGWIAARLNLVGPDAVSVLNRYAYFIAFPALIIQSLWATPFGLLEDVRPYTAAILGLAAALLAVILAARAFRWAPPVRAAAGFCTVWGNAAYLGIPFVTLVLGPSVAGEASALAALFIVVTLPVGMALLAAAGPGSEAGILRRLISTPLLWAALAGIVASGVHAFVAPGLANSIPILNLLGMSASPVALFAIGAFLAEIGTHAFRPLSALGTSVAAKLLIAPLVAWVAVRLLAVPHDLAAVVVLEAAVPTGITAFVIADEMGGDRERVSAITLASTVVSVLTLALWSGIVGL
ncbi:MAG: AEC family transporter [Thermoplasmatota archaeon]